MLLSPEERYIVVGYRYFIYFTLKEVRFEGEESDSAFLNNSSEAMKTFGYPSVSLRTMLQWQAEWILSGGRTLNKPTHFEERKGKY